MDTDLVFTRAAGLAQLAAFTPLMGARYEADRNTDAGPSSPTTSRLSPYLRRRLVLESEAIDHARQAHGQAAEKFVQEVVWRTYFKFYLESRPALWHRAQLQLEDAEAQMLADPAFAARVASALEGRTGIACFDDWARELVDRNWLHNHARMWFASIWIFTLGLPWALGADFFLRHLVDGDPASNTLSWRWVAGLHTRGKHYVARAENIKRFSAGRYAPSGLNESPRPLSEPDPLPLPRVLTPPGDAPPGEATLLLHLDDLHPESLPLGRTRILSVYPVIAHARGAAEPVRRADRLAMADAIARAATHFACPVAPPEPGMPVIAAWAPLGPSGAALPPCARVMRPRDRAAAPHCTGTYRAALSGIQNL
jgi:deoxyribodipyrimidine photo-lyase